MNVTVAPLERFRPARSTLEWGTLLVVVELAWLGSYVWATDSVFFRPEILLLPFVWLNVSLWAIIRVRPPAASDRTKLIALFITLFYFSVLVVLSGIVKSPAGPESFRIAAQLPPGWGPALFYTGSQLQVALIPYQAIGYLTLSYLVYVTILDASGTVAGGLLGLVSCVSCTFPIIAALVSGVFGGGTALATAAYSHSYLLSTAIFLVTVGLLAYRPVMGGSSGESDSGGESSIADS